jgi:hypothetical protein
MLVRAIRPLAISRHATRSFSRSHIVREAEVGSITPKKPVGGFRGGVFGFLLGFSAASAFASYQLLEEYKTASALLQASVEELQSSAQKVSTHVRRIEAVEKDLKALAENTSSKDDVTKVRAEMKKLYDGLHVEFLDLRAHVWGMQQDLHSVLKREGTSLR